MIQRSEVLIHATTRMNLENMPSEGRRATRVVRFSFRYETSRTEKSIEAFPGGSAGKESACNAGDLGLIPGLGRSPGEGNG